MPNRVLCSNSNANPVISFKAAASAAISLGILILNGCSSSSFPKANSSAPTSSSTAKLAISSTLPAASQGSAYNAAVTVSGGTSPYTFSIASGALPTGVALGDTSGTISGTPTASGNFSFALSVSDSRGISQQQSLQLSVSGSAASNPPASNPPNTTATPTPSGPSFSNLQRSGGWGVFGQGPPNFVDCSPSPCDGIAFSMTQEVNSPSLSGHATIFNVGGTTPYSDALFNNHLIGPNSTQGMPDNDGSQVPSYYNFTYDVYFYGEDLSLAQALEFDINQFFGGMGFIWGHECRIASGNEWDVWDNANAKWVPTGVPCHPNSNSWNHLTIKVQRTSDNHLTYQSITLNGDTATLNWSLTHGQAPNWYGVTINYQMDGNQRQDPYNVYLDNLTFSYQ